MSESNKKIAYFRFSKIRSLKSIPQEAQSANQLDVQECYSLESPKGHIPNWEVVLANFTALRTLEGFKKGLVTLQAKFCPHLKYATGLPKTCKIAYFDGSKIKSLQQPTEVPNVYIPMTKGIEVLSLAECTELKSLRGIASSVKELNLDQSGVRYLAYLPEGIRRVSAKACPDLRYMASLPESCEELDLSFSSIRRLKGIPLGIKEIRLYNCYAFDAACLKDLHPSILPRIKGLDAQASKYAKALYEEWGKHILKGHGVVQLKEHEVFYKLPKHVHDLRDVQIPKDVTIFDANENRNFYDLGGLSQYPNLRVLLLSKTSVSSFDFPLISESVEILDVRNCPNVRSFARLPERKKKIHILSSFSGERAFYTVPQNADINFEGAFLHISRQARPTPEGTEKTYS